jgi:hypothetical protein
MRTETSGGLTQADSGRTEAYTGLTEAYTGRTQADSGPRAGVCVRVCVAEPAHAHCAHALRTREARTPS